MKKINKIVAFDFDDTLVETDSLIGARFAVGHRSFEDFIFDNNIHFVEFNKGFWWVDSANYALLEDCTIPDNHEIEFDYAQTMSINTCSIRMINPMFVRMKESINDETALTLVVTARGGETTVFSPSLGHEVTSSNRAQISNFLLENKVQIPDHHLHTVGDMMHDTSLAKAHVLASYIEKHHPEELVFYDDSERNLRSVNRFCSSKFPDTKLSMFKVVDGLPLEYYDNSKKGIKEHLREILSRIAE